MGRQSLIQDRLRHGVRGAVAGLAVGSLLMAAACLPVTAEASTVNPNVRRASGTAQVQSGEVGRYSANGIDGYGAAGTSEGANGVGVGGGNGTSGAGQGNGNVAQSAGDAGNQGDSAQPGAGVGDDPQSDADGSPVEGNGTDGTQVGGLNGQGNQQGQDGTAGDGQAGQSDQPDQSEADQNNQTVDPTLSELDRLAAANRNVIAEGEYTIVSALGSNLVLDVSAGSNRNGANVQIYQDNASAAQRWIVTKDAKGYLTITNEKSGKPLDVSGGNARPGANVQQYAANGTAAQKWIAVPNNGTVTLRSGLDGQTALTLDVSGASARNGANVQIYAANGTAAQSWRFEALPKVNEPMKSYWNAHLWLGRPTAAAVDTGDGVKQQFQHGLLYHRASTNATVAVRADAIGVKYVALGGEKSALGFPVAEAGADSAKRGQVQRFEHGDIVWSAKNGAFAMTDQGVIDYWNSQKAGAGWLGYPKGDTVSLGSGVAGQGAASQAFDGGTVINDPRHTVVPAIWNHWASGPSAAGSAAGLGAGNTGNTGTGAGVASGASSATSSATGRDAFGQPTDSIIVQYPNGIYFKQFPNGIIFATSATDTASAMDLTGDMYDYWKRHNLGVPSGGRVQGSRLGYWQDFAGGRVYWSPNGGVHLVKGDFLKKYAALGYDAGALGYPTSDEQKLNRAGGISQVFEHGQIHWSPKTGAHATRGAILDYWKSQNWENGWLGYPTGDQLDGLRDGGSSQTFQGGTVFWSDATGAHGVTGGILNSYAARRYEGGDLGYPTDEEHDWGQGRAQDFQHGTLFWNGCGKRGWQNPAGLFQVSSCNVWVPGSGRFAFATPTRIGMSATRQQSIDAMINRAYEYLGTRYVWDYALRPGEGVDCAGLVMQALYAGGLQISGDYNPSNHWYDPWHSHDANNMFNDGRFMHVPLDQRQRGDLISWPGHIAIYLGNDQIIDANVPVVKFNSLWAYGTPRGVIRPFV
ncbi:hypothetical protein CSQ85_06935 [Bifidobacterium rousetti]|uniref:RICIN domain-containing protein n=1 Tax=Bifidobacterium rousetti TaxID=2045439 RepID=UPI00123A6CCC|nr:RICIN domain-containing protein [Bifidobacterium rousetti]KAA8818946.1 hypothetical protein CSQ85_06935 [Bifidobacterium rousetti]